MTPAAPMPVVSGWKPLMVATGAGVKVEEPSCGVALVTSNPKLRFVPGGTLAKPLATALVTGKVTRPPVALSRVTRPVVGLKPTNWPLIGGKALLLPKIGVVPSGVIPETFTAPAVVPAPRLKPTLEPGTRASRPVTPERTDSDRSAPDSSITVTRRR